MKGFENALHGVFSKQPMCDEPKSLNHQRWLKTFSSFAGKGINGVGQGEGRNRR